MDQIKALAELFFQELKPNSIGARDSFIRKAEETFTMKVDQGMPVHHIECAIRQYKEKHPTQEELRKLLIVDQIFTDFVPPAEPVRVEDKGLMEEGRFYFHPKLQKAPPPPVITITDDGEFISSYDHEEFFLEMIDRFSMEDLVNYFYRKASVSNRNYKRDSRGFEYMFNQVIIEDPLNPLDLVLFTIDAAVALAIDMDRPLPKSAVELVDSIDEGFRIYEEKYNYCSIMGLDCVIPRC